MTKLDLKNIILFDTFVAQAYSNFS